MFTHNQITQSMVYCMKCVFLLNDNILNSLQKNPSISCDFSDSISNQLMKMTQI